MPAEAGIQDYSNRSLDSGCRRNDNPLVDYDAVSRVRDLWEAPSQG